MSNRLSMRRRLAAAGAITALLGVANATPALAETPDVTRGVRHAISTVQHFDPDPECGTPGATEYATGNDHLIIVDDGDSAHVTFVETFHILVVYDDPAWPTERRQGTYTQQFNLTKGGTTTISETFHDFVSDDDSRNFLKIDYYRTFVSTGDDVRVDRDFVRKDVPPC